MQVEATVRHDLTPTRMAVVKRRNQKAKTKNQKTTSIGGDVVKLEPSYVVGGNVKQCSCCGKQKFLKSYT